MTDPIELARPLLPAWVVWGSVVTSWGVTLLSSWLAAGALWLLGAHWLSNRASLHWTEVARIAFPWRRGTALLLVLAPMVHVAFAVLLSGPLAPCSPAAVGLVAAALALVPALVVRFRSERLLRPHVLRLGTWLLEGCHALWLLFPHGVVLIAMMLALPHEMNLRAGVTIGVGLLLVGAAIWGVGPILAVRVGLAHNAGERLRRVVNHVSDEVGVRPHATYEITSTIANAFAFPFSQRLLVTNRLLDELDDAQVGAIIAHELGHLGEPKLKALTRYLSVLAIAVFASHRPIQGTFGTKGLIVAMGAAVFAYAMGRRAARRLEVRADHVAREHQGDTGVYASALERMHRANLLPAVMPAGRRPHPDLFDRLIAAGVQPDYPRPNPPSHQRRALIFLVLVFLLMVPQPGVEIALLAYTPEGDPLLTANWQVMTAGDGVAMSDLALAEYHQGSPERAVTLYHAAVELDPSSVFHRANLAIVLAGLKRCDEAAGALDDAETRIGDESSDDDRRIVTVAVGAVDGCEERRAGDGSTLRPEPPP